MDDAILNVWLQPQMLRQEAEMDCAVAVFGALANLSRGEILEDMPDAINGKTVEEWEEYLTYKGIPAKCFQSPEEYSLPSAHLVEIAPGRYHWIFQAADGGIHDPSPAWQHYPPRLIKMSFYSRRILSIATNIPALSP
jgi:hypothetical protein